MNVSDTKKVSKTDWARIDAMSDENIDTSDIPPLDETFFNQATFRIPEREPCTLNIDSKVLTWFKSQGEFYEERINAALRIYAEAHQELI